MPLKLIKGDLLKQSVEVIVNPWNKNIIPWWLLLPQGVSGQIKQKGGYKPFNELIRIGPIKTGTAVLTSAGKLKYKGIIHVAGLNIFWVATERSIRDGTKNALLIALENNFKSIAFPVIGGGTGGVKKIKAINYMKDEINKSEFKGEIIIVSYLKN